MEKKWYVVKISSSLKMFILWEISIPPVVEGEESIVKTSRGDIRVKSKDVYIVKSRQSWEKIIKSIRIFQEKYPETKDYTIETH